MKSWIFVLMVVTVFQACWAVNSYTKAIVKNLQGQCKMSPLMDYFRRVGSLDPSLVTVIMYGPNANPVALLCLVTNFNEAIDTIQNNLGDVFAVVPYYQGKCNSDDNLNRALAALADKEAQARLKTVAQNIINGLPAEVASIATDALNQAFSNEDITEEKAKDFAARIKGLTTETKQAIVAKLPSTKAFLNKNGAYNAPYTVLLNNFPILLTSKTPTADQKTKVNNAIAKAFEYVHKNAPELLNFVWGWLKSLTLDPSVSNNGTVTTAFSSSASKLMAAAQTALILPPTQQEIENLFTDPYQI